MPLVEIREACPEDLERLCAARYTKTPAIHLDRLRDAAAGYVRLLIAEEPERIVGFALLVFRRPSHWSDGHVSDRLPQVVDLYVIPERRGEGIGAALLAAMEDMASASGHSALFLGVDPLYNPRAHALYQRLGYRAVQDAPYREHWEFDDSDGSHHEGDEWTLDMVKELLTHA
jgi:GNAT superfamily N-acetyltransferase